MQTTRKVAIILTFLCLSSSKSAIVLRKCCKSGEIFKNENCSLHEDSNLSSTNYLENHLKLNIFFNNDTKIDWMVNPDGELCPSGYFPVPSSGVFSFQDEILQDEEYGNYEPMFYCLEFFDFVNQSVKAIVCEAPLSRLEDNMGNNLGMIISMPFLLATFLVYAILPDRNLHQRALMFYVLTLLISYMLLVSINLSENIPTPWCEVCGFSTLYFFMVSFFWMNVICFDIWYTFSGGRGFVGSKRTSERKRLLLYSIYAFGVPLLVALLVLFLQSKVLSESSEHNPGIGIKKCFLGDGWPNLWYFYLEAGLLVFINIIFFTLTALKIRQVKKETSMLKHNDSQRHSYEKDKQKFNLYVKLLFAMGVNWSMEVISWLVNWRTGNNIQYIWWATDFFNAVYGVFIFFMFVFKKKIWKLLQRRYYTFIGKPHLAHTMTTTNATRTSHYSSTNYSTADTTVTDRTNVSNGNGRGGRPEEMALRTVT